MSYSTNLKSVSTPTAQLGSSQREIFLGELRQERIDAAFGGAVSTTEIRKQRIQKTEATATPARETAGRGIVLRTRFRWDRLAMFVTERRWQGYVTDVTPDTFHAVIFDTSPDSEDETETVEFTRDTVNSLMRHLIVPGAIFFWDLGFQRDPSGQIVRQSVVSFPMIPRWDADELSRAKERAAIKYQQLGWESREPRANSDDAADR